MRFETVYKAVFILMAISVLLAYFRDPIVYFLYGYSPTLVGSSASDAYVAFDRTLLARSLIWYLSVALCATCLLISCIAILIRSYVDSVFKFVALLISLSLLIVYFVALSVPTRAF